MPHQDQTQSTHASSSIEQSTSAMQVLSLEEMRAVAGGPEIKNGGGGVSVVTTTDSTGTPG